MKIRTFITLGAVIITMMGASCSKYSGFKKSDSGIYYKFYVENKDSLKPVEGSILTMNIVYRMEIDGKDSIFFNSADLPRAFEINLAKSEFVGDIYEAFGMLHKGDSATFIINANDFFTKTAKYPTLPEGVDSTSMMYFDVKLLSAETMEERQKAEAAKAEKLKNEEAGKIQSYLTANKVTALPTESGIYIINQNPGAGRGIQKGDFVKINLTVSSITGEKIFSTLDNDRPITFEFGQPFDTKGFDEAIANNEKRNKSHRSCSFCNGLWRKG
jgi:FKBP-type peptidyl-prolyl cis-trans isomerase FkpA